LFLPSALWLKAASRWPIGGSGAAKAARARKAGPV